METSIQGTINDLNQYLQGTKSEEDLIKRLQNTLDFLKDSEGISENTTMENLNEGKKSNYMTELAEIDKQSALVALEAKINKLAEMAEAKTNRLSMVHEDENLSELISKQAVKEMQRSIKEIEKLKEKLLKEFTKKGGKMTEVIDEEIDDKINPGNTEEDQAKKDKYPEEAMPPHMKKEEVEEEMKDPNTGVVSDDSMIHNYLDEDDSKEETNEEMNRWQKLAGL